MLAPHLLHFTKTMKQNLDKIVIFKVYMAPTSAHPCAYAPKEVLMVRQ